MSALLDFIMRQPSTADQVMGLLPLIHEGGGTMKSAPTAGAPGHWASVARNMAQNKYGYTPQDWNALNYIIEHESNWNPQALNQSSGAWGIPQILPMEGRPERGTLNPKQQISWLLDYIKDRYGGPQQAYQFKLANGWY